MTAQTFHCPACGAPLLPKGNMPVMSCPHCFTSVIVPEDLRQDADAAPWNTLLFDNFGTNDNNWLSKSLSDGYFVSLTQAISDGRYRWEGELRNGSSISTSWLGGYRVSDFHLVVNCKHIAGSKAGSSWGLIFRIQDNHNYYWFRITDSLFFAVSVTKEGQWQNLVEWTRTDAIKSNGVNQLEVIARESHFIFLINGQIVAEIDDDHYSQGVVGVAIEGYKPGEKIIYDFLDFTLRERRGT